MPNYKWWISQNLGNSVSKLRTEVYLYLQISIRRGSIAQTFRTNAKWLPSQKKSVKFTRFGGEQKKSQILWEHWKGDNWYQENNATEVWKSDLKALKRFSNICNSREIAPRVKVENEMTSSNLKKSSQLSHLSSPAAFQSKSSCSLSYRPPKTFQPFLPLIFQFGNGLPAHTRRQRGPVKYSVFPALKSELYPATTSKKSQFS